MALKKMKLNDIKAVDLKRELEERDQEISGTKAVLRLRLQAALEAEGEDPQNFFFEVAGSANDHIKMLEQNSQFLKDELKENLKEELKSNLEEHSRILVQNFEENTRKFEEHLQDNDRKFEEVKNDIVGVKIKLTEGLKQVEKGVDGKIAAIEERVESLKKVFGQGVSTDMKTESGVFIKTMHAKPPTYDGKTPWSTYRKQFEAAAAVNGWTNGDKATGLVIALRGDALNILQAMKRLNSRILDGK